MPTRHTDWLSQAQRDLAHADRSLQMEDYEWACFAAQQAAEKAVKAVYQRLGAIAWGHSVTQLMTRLPDETRPTQELVDRAKALDKHYVATRYPNGFDSGAPFEYYTRAEAKRSLSDAQAIIKFCEDILARLTGSDREP
jgi:HEPN domain-containing protein